MPKFASRLRFAGASIAALTAIAGLAQAQDKPKAEAPSNHGVLWFETAEWDKILVSPKDQALKSAMKMLPARLSDIPSELPPEAPVPPGAFELAGRLISSPVRGAITYNPENQGGGFFGGGAVLSFMGDQAGADKTAGLVNSLVKLTPFKPKASKAFSTMSEVLLPFGAIRGGPRQTAKGWAYDLHVGTMADPDAVLGELDALKLSGVTPYFKARFDASPLEPLLDFVEMLSGNDPSAAKMVEGVKNAGVLGPKGIKASYITGYADDRMVSETRISGLAKMAEAAGVSKRMLAASDLAIFPSDAHWGFVTTVDPAQIKQQITTAAQMPQAEEALAQFKQITGVDPVADLVGPIGGVFGAYLADSTGGGGLMSMVFAVSVADPQRLAGAMTKLASVANKTLAEPDKARGYALIRQWSDPSAPGCQFHSISFAGLPVPLELTYAFAGKWMVAGLSPQAALVAARQVSGKGDAGLSANERVASAMPKGKEFMSFSFNDPAKTIREGYPITSMVGSAMSNLVRSRAGSKESREVGLVTPPYADLAAGARAQVAWTTWDGDDYVERSEADRSQLVQLAMRAGQFMPFLPLVSLGGAGAAFGAFQEMNKQHMPVPDFGGMHDEDANGAEDATEGKKPGF